VGVRINSANNILAGNVIGGNRGDGILVTGSAANPVTIGFLARSYCETVSSVCNSPVGGFAVDPLRHLLFEHYDLHQMSLAVANLYLRLLDSGLLLDIIG
jgi:parallel beta-helix repeat protein